MLLPPGREPVIIFISCKRYFKRIRTAVSPRNKTIQYKDAAVNQQPDDLCIIHCPRATTRTAETGIHSFKVTFVTVGPLHGWGCADDAFEITNYSRRTINR